MVDDGSGAAAAHNAACDAHDADGDYCDIHVALTLAFTVDYEHTGSDDDNTEAARCALIVSYSA